MQHLKKTKQPTNPQLTLFHKSTLTNHMSVFHTSIALKKQKKSCLHASSILFSPGVKTNGDTKSTITIIYSLWFLQILHMITLTKCLASYRM